MPDRIKPILHSLLMVIVLTIVTACSKKDKEEVPSAVTPNNFLSAGKYDKLIVQIQSVNGYELSAQTISNLSAFLEARLQKPAGIQVIQSNVSFPGKTVLTLSELKELEKKNRTEYPSGKTLTAYFLVTDGEYSESTSSSKVLGIAYSPTAMVLFGKSIQDFSGGLNQPSATTLQTTVALHEFCHILGLVDNGTDMETPHQDEAHGRHCNNTDCLMYYQVESSESILNLLGSGIPSLDNHCINDLRANGGK